MADVTRLLTFVDLNDANPGFSVSALHQAVLADGRRVVLLDDRGWVSSRPPAEVEEVVRTSRVVVGPDEPFGGLSRAETEAGHWNTLTRTLSAHGVEVDARALAALPHDVELSDRLRALLNP